MSLLFRKPWERTIRQSIWLLFPSHKAAWIQDLTRVFEVVRQLDPVPCYKFNDHFPDFSPSYLEELLRDLTDVNPDRTRGLTEHLNGGNRPMAQIPVDLGRDFPVLCYVIDCTDKWQASYTPEGLLAFVRTVDTK